MASIRDRFSEHGAEVEGQVKVDISYDIIRQFSAQLYTNPRKAIEELVCNSYDAGATDCHVRIPYSTEDPLAVLDNGDSMDFLGLQGLWKVASSPKVAPEGQARVANNRSQIGKFGVGKLAAFALGDRLTHIAVKDGWARVVSVGQSEIKEQEGGKRPTFDVYKIKEDAAVQILQEAVDGLPIPEDEDWPSWTLALVEEIDEDNVGRALQIGYLKPMVRTALPISADFQVYVEGDLVDAKKIPEDNIEVRVPVLDKTFRERLEDTLQAFWQGRLEVDDPGDVPSELFAVKLTGFPNPENRKETMKAIEVPKLGPVAGEAILSHTSLTTAKLKERGYRGNGFAVSVYGKLVNPEDELFGITQRSHKYWRRFLARVEMPGLDDALLVQRNDVSENKDETLVAREVLKALFNYTRSKAQKAEEDRDAYKPGSFGSRLRIRSPVKGPLALQGLLPEGWPEDGLESVDVDFVTQGEEDPAIAFDKEDGRILINEEHPLISSLEEFKGRSEQLRHVFGEVLAGNLLMKGYLGARGMDADEVEDASTIFEDALRSAADYIRDEIEAHIEAIDEASYEGGLRFELAVVRAFRSLRLSATSIGGSDAPDGRLIIPRAGEKNFEVSIEAKGSKGVVNHEVLRASTVERHKEESDCDHAIAIAREFQLDGQGDKKSALLRECEGVLTLLSVEAIANILRLHGKRPFTYDALTDVLTSGLPPDELEAYVEERWAELPELGLMRDVLEVAHVEMEKESVNKLSPGMLLVQDRIRGRGVSRDKIIGVLEAVAVSTHMVVFTDPNTHQFELKAPPETILEAMQDRPGSQDGGEGA